ncbi:LysR family transcriptional regulator [Methyloceanibacter sp.]|uniref:LysR family transcriptional regulator n=1 Tax=Methyloceanibacter sp. TaxID=1965321 RepID=UPI002B77108B|nr:LysR family transcriptional regulator [Methyloceanibacter sp.]HML92920.1 LysR family transcriptional regulator [Methyloceanibacter sp.]
MQLSRADLADFAYFIAVAKHCSFRRAAVECGVSASALSHAVRGLETRLGVRLLNRTTRSVTLTAAGEDLRASIEAPIEHIGQAVENLNRFRDAPTGRVRISVPGDAVPLILEPVMPLFVDRYPDVEIEISVNNRLIDVIGSGFDAGIRYGDTVPEDMVAQCLSADIRWIAAASPSYLARFGRPEHPGQLRDHRCVRIRLGNDQMYNWEFEKAGETIVIPTPGQVTVDESHAAVGLGLQGVGIIYGAEPILRPYLQRGALERLFDEWDLMGSGYHIYYSSRRNVPMALRLLIDLIREIRPCGL